MNKLILILAFAAGLGTSYGIAKVITYFHDQVTIIQQNVQKSTDCGRLQQEATTCRIKHR